MTTANQRTEALEYRITALEKRIAALELVRESGKEKLSEIVDAWQDVLLRFADNFGIDVPELNHITEESTKTGADRRKAGESL